MTKQILSVTSDDPAITIKTHADLIITGWNQQEVTVDGGSRYSLNVRQDGNSIAITSTENCLVMAPFKSRIIVERANGDAFITDLGNDLVCQKIGGDLHLNKIGRIAVEQVGGDCSALEIAGDLESRKVGGDFIGKNVRGHAIVERVGGDFLLLGVNGPVTCRAGGDIHISLTGKPEGTSSLAGGGDVTVNLPEETGASLNLNSSSDDIHIDLGGQVEDIEERTYLTSIGDGSASFSLRAGGSIEVTDRPWDEDILSDVQQEIEDHIQALSESMHDRLQDTAERVADEAVSRAEKKVQAALKRIEHLGYVSSQGVGHAYSATIRADFPPRKPEPPVSPKPSKVVSGEERLMILRMVETKKISVEEAEKLLEALEGK